VIESVSFTGGAVGHDQIASQTFGGLPERMNMKLVEALARPVQG